MQNLAAPRVEDLARFDGRHVLRQGWNFQPYNYTSCFYTEASGG
jgi:hypothetical protein